LEDKIEAAEAAPSKNVKPGRRICLSCGKQFKSAWIGNRICEPCTKRGAAPDDHYWGHKRNDPR